MKAEKLKLEVKRMLTGEKNDPKDTEEQTTVKSFAEDQQKDEAFETRERGKRAVPVKLIVGSVGRYQDFDGKFKFKSKDASPRLQWIRKAMMEGRQLDPVLLYQIKKKYYILDGNHRVSVAKSLGHNEILAKVLEFIPSKKTLQNMLYRERAEFMDRTQLQAEISLTEVTRYNSLLEQLSEHHQYLQKKQGDEVTFVQAAADWYKTIYRPLFTIIQRSHLIDSFPERTVADLYTYITLHQWHDTRDRQYGIGIDKLLRSNMQSFRRAMLNVRDRAYPELKQEIIVFILINSQIKKLGKVIEKLYEIDEVREVHSVHGDMDILVKIRLTRDLLSSDSEIISYFLRSQIHHISGIKKTITLIPGSSKIKKEELP